MLAAMLISELSNGVVTTLWDYSFSTLDAKINGVIVRSDIIMMRSGEKYDIQYGYTVNGKLYYGSKVNYQTKVTNKASVITNRYKLRDEVAVYYDSSNPNFSVLELGKITWGIYAHVLGWVLFGTFMFYVYKI